MHRILILNNGTELAKYTTTQLPDDDMMGVVLEVKGSNREADGIDEGLAGLIQMSDVLVLAVAVVVGSTAKASTGATVDTPIED